VFDSVRERVGRAFRAAIDQDMEVLDLVAAADGLRDPAINAIADADIVGSY